MTFQKVLLKLHLYAALVSGLFLLIVSLTGAALVFENQIDHLLNPALFYVQPADKRLSLDELLSKVRAAFPGVKAGGVYIPESDDLACSFSLNNSSTVFVNPHTGDILGTRSTQEAEKSLARRLHVLHTRLMAGQTGGTIVGATTLICIFLTVSGVVLWWPRRIWSVKRTAAWRRINFDLHNALGIYSAIFVLIITVSGAVIAYEGHTNNWINALNSSPPPAKPTQSTVVPGKPPITLGEAARIAMEALPGAKISSLTVPNGGKQLLTAYMKFPEDRTPAGRSHVFIDQYSGAVLLVESTREAQLGTQILNLKRSIHTGDIFGLPSRLLYALVCLILASQIVTGLIMWWKPKAQAVTAIPPSQHGAKPQPIAESAAGVRNP